MEDRIRALGERALTELAAAGPEALEAWRV